ncbi:hypothetical protein M8J76_003080 [Diaphorina citri]|nr:hypothetical protein M8J75_008521 [Diaphorina citri]KAI5726457.1 hypothetical protein M8J76_003080 [Diaphorina citri]
METGTANKNGGKTKQKASDVKISTVKTSVTAPFASIEDLSPEEETTCSRMNSQNSTETKEGTKMACLEMPPTPRIDISRASSSSQHDDSSPEREILGGESGGTGEGEKLGGFCEEMAQDLRNSTEELHFHDVEGETKNRRKKLQQQQAVADARKESVTSDVGFLSISGRTSRLSSVGSATSQGSGASNVSGLTASSYGSHISSTSHLSAHSNLSKASRCSSPYKMLLETSFCGPKPVSTVKAELGDPPNKEIIDLIKNTENLIAKDKTKCLENGKKEGLADIAIKKVKQNDLQTEKNSESKIKKTCESRILEDPNKIFISLHEELPKALLDTLKTPTQPKPSRSSNRDLLSAHSNGERKHRSKSKKSKSKDKEHRSKSRSRNNPEPTKIQQPVATSSTKLHSGEDQVFISLHEDPKRTDDTTKELTEAITKMKPFTNPTLKKFISQNVDEISVAPSTQKSKPEPLDPSLHQIISLHEDPPPKRSQNKDGKTVVKVVPDSSPVPTSMITDSDNQIFISLHEDNIKPITPKPEVRHQSKQSVHSLATQFTRDKTRATIATTKELASKDSIGPKTTKDPSSNTLPKSKAKVSERNAIGNNHLHIFIPLKGDEEIRPIELESAGPMNPSINLYPNDDPLVKIIPLHGDDDEIQKDWSRSQSNIDKNEPNNNLLACNENPERTNRSMPNMTTCPELAEYKAKPTTLDLMSVERPERPVKSLTHLAREESRTPSPGRSNLARRSSESYKGSRGRRDSSSEREKKSTGKSLFSLTSLFRRNSSSRHSSHSRSRTDVSSRQPDCNMASYVSPYNQARNKSNEPDVIIIPLHSPSDKPSALTPTEIKCPENKTNIGKEELKQMEISDLEKHPMDIESVSESFKQEVIVETNKILQLLKNDISIDEPDVEENVVHNEKVEEESVNKVELNKNVPIENVKEKHDKTDTKKETVQNQVEEIKIENKVAEEIKINKPNILQLETKCIKQIEEFAMSKSSAEKSKEEIKVTPEGEMRVNDTIVITPDDIESESLLAKHTSDSDLHEGVDALKGSFTDDRKSSDSDFTTSPIGNDETERKQLVNQAESVEEELPYVPTTLPLERSIGVSIVPVNKRSSIDIQTCPIDRPRSTTPINPGLLDSYKTESPSTTSNKMQIKLPKNPPPVTGVSTIVPSSSTTTGTSTTASIAPPVFTSSATTASNINSSPCASSKKKPIAEIKSNVSSFSPSNSASPSRNPWVSFDELPDRTKLPPKQQKQTQTVSKTTVYPYVNPEECSCDCHTVKK